MCVCVCVCAVTCACAPHPQPTYGLTYILTTIFPPLAIRQVMEGHGSRQESQNEIVGQPANRTGPSSLICDSGGNVKTDDEGVMCLTTGK